MVMTQHHDAKDRVARFHQAASLLGQSRVVMSEVRVCGISKLSVPEVVPT